jgi:hypothetical protein
MTLYEVFFKVYDLFNFTKLIYSKKPPQYFEQKKG